MGEAGEFMSMEGGERDRLRFMGLGGGLRFIGGVNMRARRE